MAVAALHSPALQRPSRPRLQPQVLATLNSKFSWSSCKRSGKSLQRLQPAVACGASAYLSSRAFSHRARGVRRYPATSDTSPLREGALLLVTGGSRRLAELCTPSNCDVLHVPGPFGDLEDVQALIQKAADDHPGQEIAGLLHLGGALASDTASDFGRTSALASSAATEALDESLRSLTLLVAGLVPRLKPGTRLMTWSSDRAHASPSTWLETGGGMTCLAAAFMEQYTEALAYQLRETFTVLGIRCNDEALRIALDPTGDPDTRQRLEKDINALWSMPHREAHGQIFPVGRPEITWSASSARGASVLGCSLDVAWALKDAAKDAASYPVEGRPKTYKALANALDTTPERLVWAHGASDVILRTAMVAAKGSGPPKALVQGPSWHNASYLLRAGGMQIIETVPYPDPWSTDSEGTQQFWESLRERIASDAPSLVYLVHPHFPTGVKEANFGAQLRDLLSSMAVELAAGDTLVAVDQTYLGFTEKSEDDDILETLAQFHHSLVLIRSLSKVEGLAGLRLGYAKSTAQTAKRIAETLPFSGGLYISEMALRGALAAVQGPVAAEHRRQVLTFYQDEQSWLRSQLEDLGVKTFAAEAPFFVLRAPRPALEHVVEEGAAIQIFSFQEMDQQRCPAVCLVADRASNLSTVRMLKSALEKTGGKPNWAEMLKPMLG